VKTPMARAAPPLRFTSWRHDVERYVRSLAARARTMTTTMTATWTKMGLSAAAAEGRRVAAALGQQVSAELVRARVGLGRVG
jgi:hypothetical protein